MVPLPRLGSHAPRAAAFHLKALLILSRRGARKRCATSCIDLQIFKHVVNWARWIIASLSKRNQIQNIFPPLLVLDQAGEYSFAFRIRHALKFFEKFRCAHRRNSLLPANLESTASTKIAGDTPAATVAAYAVQRHHSAGRRKNFQDRPAQCS